MSRDTRGFLFCDPLGVPGDPKGGNVAERIGSGQCRGQRRLRRLLAICALLAIAVGVAPVRACPICSGTAPRLTLVQQFINSDAVVLAVARGDAYEAVAVVQGAVAIGDRIPLRSVTPDVDAVYRPGQPVLLLRAAIGRRWSSPGSAPLEALAPLRSLTGARRSSDMTLRDWEARVVQLGPMLEHPAPLLASTAYGEIARAPYAAMRALRGRIAPSRLAGWLADPRLEARRSLYWLLLGINGDAGHAQMVRERVAAAAAARSSTDLASMLAADMELGGRTRRDALARVYFEDRRRSIDEVQQAVLAFTVHADAGDDALRREVAQRFTSLARSHRALAGLVAADLARWQYWDAVPDYISLLQARRLHPAALQPVIDYLAASGRADAAAAVRGVTSRM